MTSPCAACIFANLQKASVRSVDNANQRFNPAEKICNFEKYPFKSATKIANHCFARKFSDGFPASGLLQICKKPLFKALHTAAQERHKSL
jgi:hypothetical protein